MRFDSDDLHGGLLCHRLKTSSKCGYDPWSILVSCPWFVNDPSIVPAGRWRILQCRVKENHVSATISEMCW